MRLPWPFSRPQRSSAADATQVFAARPRGPQAWRELPVLATSVGKPPLVAPTAPFRAELAGAAAAPIALAPLTHGRSLDAPNGLISNIVQAAPAHAATAANRDVPVTPLAARRHSRNEADAEPSSAEARVALDVGALPAVSGAPLERAQDAGLPERRAVVVDDRPVLPRPQGSFVSAAGQASLTLPPSGRIGKPQGTGRTSPTPVTSVPEAARPAGPAAPVAATTLTQEPPRPTSARLTLGQARRLGLGAPIDPVAIRVARSQPAPDLTLAAQVERPAPTTSDAPSTTPVTNIASPEAHLADHGRQVSPAAVPNAQPPSPPLARSAARAPSVPLAAARSADVARPVQARARVQRAPRAVTPTEVPSLPIVGARPIGPGVQLARAAARPAATGGATAGSAEAAGSGAASGVRIHRGAEASDLAGALDARAFTSGSDIYLPASHGPLSGAKAQSLLAHEMTHVAQQRRLGSSLPAEDSAHGQQLEAQAVAAERAGRLPLASVPDRRPEPPLPEEQGSLPVTIELSAGEMAAASSAPPAQRAPEAKFTDPDDAFRARLDSNEEYLFGHFERRLRRQLISERERGGTLIDAL